MNSQDDEMDEFDAFLQSLGYVFYEESDNPVYAQFLR